MPRATQDATRLQSSVVYGVFTLYDRLFQGVPLDSILPRRGPTTPVSPRRHGFGLFRVRSPLLTESLFIFSSYGYLDVSVPHVRLPYGMTGLQPAGLPHSDILGSRAICASPKLFAAYHVLHRLREPRHPPSALAYFLSPRTYVRVDISSARSTRFFFIDVQNVKDPMIICQFFNMPICQFLSCHRHIPSLGNYSCGE